MTKFRYTNVYAAQIFLLQAPIKSKKKAEILKRILNKNEAEVSDDLIDEMQRCPMRTSDETTLEEPAIAQLIETMKFNGEAIKVLINEKFGDGVMSSADMKMELKKVKGPSGEDRVQIIMDGLFIPFKEQLSEGNSETEESFDSKKE